MQYNQRCKFFGFFYVENLKRLRIGGALESGKYSNEFKIFRLQVAPRYLDALTKYTETRCLQQKVVSTYTSNRHEARD